MNINVRVIEHSQQRYDTCGDWWFSDSLDTLEVRVSKMDDERYESLVAQHEIIEAMACYFAGISEKAVTTFDVEFEDARKRATNHVDFKFHGRTCRIAEEPGDQPDAPYYRQHQIATGVERFLAAEYDVSWIAYEETINDL